MMHIPALVIIDKSVPSEHLYFEIEESLKPYSADLAVPKHVVLTRAEYIDATRQAYRKELREFNALMQNDPEEFYKLYPIPPEAKRRRQVLEVFSSETTADENIWALIRNSHHDSEFDEDDNLLGTDNPNAKFLSWERGGVYRHSILNTDGRKDVNGELVIKGFDTMRKKDLRTMASVGILVDKNSVWIEPEDLPVLPEESFEEGNMLARFDDLVFQAISEADREDWLLVIDVLSNKEA